MATDSTDAQLGESNSTTLRSRLVVAGLAMMVVYGVGTFGYLLLGQGRWTLSDCAYMTIISLTTVGYGEVLREFDHVAYARFFTSVLLVGGAGIAVYFISVLTTFLVEGEFLQIRRRKKMEKEIKRLSDHIIVCGAGRTGRHIVEELVATRWPLVVIETDPGRLHRVGEEQRAEVPMIIGDATDDNVLIEAGIKRAHGVVASLPDDKGNLYVVVTARELNPRLRIVSKAVDNKAIKKLQVAGANSVVSVNTIGGLRMASEMIRPNVVTFLDTMLRDTDKRLRFEEITIPPDSPLVNTRLAQSKIRTERNLLIVAARSVHSGKYTYSPGPDFVMEADMTLIILGKTDSVQRLRTSRLFNKGERANP